jgi:hypothetical protein
MSRRDVDTHLILHICMIGYNTYVVAGAAVQESGEDASGD